jgi:hypothetical protein
MAPVELFIDKPAGEDVNVPPEIPVLTTFIVPTSEQTGFG